MIDESVVQCRHGRECGACAFLDVAYGAQLLDKQEIVAQALRARGRRHVPVLATMPSPRISGYRNRAKMAIRPGRPVRMGYFKLGSRDLVDAPECQVLEPALLETLSALRQVLGLHPVPQLRFVDLRSGSDPRRQHLTLVVGAPEVPRLPLQEIETSCPLVRGVAANLNPGAGPQVIKGPVKQLRGERGVAFELPTVRLLVSPSSFFQVNLHVLPAIHERMRGFFGGCRTLLDLYAGVGTHGLALAGSFARVLCIEGQPSAVRDARESLLTSRFAHVAIVGSPVEKSVGRIATSHADAAVLNPSRQGAAPEVLRMLGTAGIRRIAYLSCEPETLARDLEILGHAGFRTVSVEPIDMMPQTRQVEALALLQAEEGGARAPRGPEPRGRTRRPSHPAARRPRRGASRGARPGGAWTSSRAASAAAPAPAAPAAAGSGPAGGG